MKFLCASTFGTVYNFKPDAIFPNHHYKLSTLLSAKSGRTVQCPNFFLLRLNLCPCQNFGIVCVPYLPLETKKSERQPPSQPCPTHDGFVRIYFCTYSITPYLSDRFRSIQSVTKIRGNFVSNVSRLLDNECEQN